MEDKAFELLTKMHSEFSYFRREVNEKPDRKADKIDIARIEHEHGSKLEAALDGYKQAYEKLEVIESKDDNLNEKVERHDINIQVIEGGRK